MHPTHPLAITGFCLLISVTARAQDKYAVQAAAASSAGRFYNAMELYKLAYTRADDAPSKAAMILNVARAYRSLGEAAMAQAWFEKANKAHCNDPLVHYHIGEALKEQGRYAEAIKAFKRFKEMDPGSTRVDAQIDACQLAMTWLEHPAHYIVDPEVLLNTPQHDIGATFSSKKNDEVVFASGRPASTGTDTDGIAGESFLDLFQSSRDKLGKWSEPVKLPPSINTPAHEGAPTFNAKRTVMYFTRCPHEKNKAFGCEIWMSRKVGSSYGEPERLDLGALASDQDTFQINRGQPALGRNDSILIFSSNQPGGQGGRDLWVVDLGRDGRPDGAPANLGPGINTAQDEKFPFLRPNGQLYFSSEGHPGMGGLDLFVADAMGLNTWGPVENLKSPLNSSGDDHSIVFDGDAEEGFFTSDRAGGKGHDDIWRFLMPRLAFALQGTCIDKRTGRPLVDARIELAGTDGSHEQVLTDTHGHFQFIDAAGDRTIKENTSYSIRVSKEQYLVLVDRLTTVSLNENTTFAREYVLQPAIADSGIALPQVLYEVNMFALTQAGKDSLETLYRVLQDNPTIRIELRSHTDSRKTRSFRGGNLELSQKRAQACVNYLVTRGIDADRMVAIGKGGSEPLVTDQEIKALPTEEAREAAHQKNRRTDFRVIGFDHLPKEPVPGIEQ